MESNESIKDILINCICGFCFLPIWYGQKLLKRNPKVWLFGSWLGKNYSDNSRAIYEYVLENKKEISPIWITHNPKVYKFLKEKGRPVELANSIKGKKACLKAGYIFLSSGITEFNMKYINGAKQIWLWHGMPIKKIEADIPQRISFFKQFKTFVRKIFVPYELHKNYDFLLSTATFFEPMMTSAFRINSNKVHSFGYPRNDIFFNHQKKSNIIKEINEKFNNPLILMYMPTFRDAKPNLNLFSEYGFSVKDFNATLEKENIVFLYKGHFYGENEVSGFSSSERFIHLTDNPTQDSYNILKDVDILLTDYSSVYFDFLLMHKPVILTPFDLDDYIKYSRPIYYDYNKYIDGIKANSWNDVLTILKEKRYFKPTEETINRFHLHKDGNSAKRIVDYILSEQL